MSSKYDNEFKRKVLLDKIDRKVAKIKSELYHDSFAWLPFGNDGEVVFNMISSQYNDFLEYASNVPTLDCALRLLESKKRKACKVKDKIRDLVLYGNAIFITLTFNDKTLAKTSFLTRRKYVARYLKANCNNYVANIDFGAKKGREHYHAVVNKDIDFTNWYKYGAIKVERVRTQESDLQRVARYVSKLTNHALKVGEGAPRLIYSRL